MLEKHKQRGLRIRIGDIVLLLKREGSEPEFKVDDSHKDFIVTEGTPDVVLRVHYGDVPKYEVSEGNKVFESGGVWSLYKKNGKYLLPLQSPALGKSPYKLAILDSDFRSGDVYIEKKHSQGQFSYPLAYPLDEVLMVNLLSLGRGIEIHACGIVNQQGEGIIFSGTSGAGKSTLANLWKSKEEITILSDDRLIVRRAGDGFQVYGTPWHGDAGVCSPENALLAKMFFLKQAPKNFIRRIDKVDAVSRLLVRCFPTFYNSEGMEYTLELSTELCKKVPCYELGFVPNESVLEFVKSMRQTK